MKLFQRLTRDMVRFKVAKNIQVSEKKKHRAKIIHPLVNLHREAQSDKNLHFSHYPDGPFLHDRLQVFVTTIITIYT